MESDDSQLALRTTHLNVKLEDRITDNGTNVFEGSVDLRLTLGKWRDLDKGF